MRCIPPCHRDSAPNRSTPALGDAPGRADQSARACCRQTQLVPIRRVSSWQGSYTGDTGTAVNACVAAAVAMVLALALIPWLKPRTIRIALALMTGACWGLLIALIAHEL